MRPLLLLTLSSLLLVTACGSSSDDVPDNRGELARLQFSYNEFGCFDGCSPRQPIAVGAHVVLAAKGDDPDARYHGRVAAPGLVIEKESMECTCTETSENGASTGTLAPGDRCYAPAVRHCSRTFALRGVHAGPAMLEVLGTDNEVVDRLALVVATTERLEAVVKKSRIGGGAVVAVTPAADGAFDVDAPVRLNFEAKAFDAQGNELRKNAADIVFVSTDAKLSALEGRAEIKLLEPGIVHITATGFGVTTPFVVRAVAATPR